MARKNTLRKRERKRSSTAAPSVRDVLHGSPERDALTKLDRMIHERIRLGIVSALAVNESLTFAELKSMLRTTDGNLSAHARRLEDAGYVECRKSFAGRMPKTTFRLKPKGRKALQRYLGHMEALIQATRDS